LSAIATLMAAMRVLSRCARGATARLADDMGDLLTTVGLWRQSRCKVQGDRADAIPAYACLAWLRKWTAGWPYDESPGNNALTFRDCCAMQVEASAVVATKVSRDLSEDRHFLSCQEPR
jgi:hypothetical protein